MDLRFPHHECEIAQSQAASQTDLATYWMHNNLVTIDGVKMGKSLGNAITLDELFTGHHASLDRSYSPMALRFCMLQAHYRSILSVSTAALQAAHQGYRKVMNGLHLLQTLPHASIPASTQSGKLDAEIYAECTACYSAMNDDFNTAKTLGSLFSLLKKINGLHNGQLSHMAISTDAFNQLRITYTTFIRDILGLKEDNQSSTAAMLEILLTLYQQAKEAKRYHQVDFIRSTLHKMGIAIKDHRNEVSWEYQ
jgi:cysteinyl-tRNA synthetase